jgi:hypothetical protein
MHLMRNYEGPRGGKNRPPRAAGDRLSPAGMNDRSRAYVSVTTTCLGASTFAVFPFLPSSRTSPTAFAPRASPRTSSRRAIRPVGLARIAPEAKAALQAGILVHELGGERNVVAIGRALGIAAAMPDAYDVPQGATRLTFRFEKRPQHVDYLPSERDPLGLGTMLGDDGLAMRKHLSKRER